MWQPRQLEGDCEVGQYSSLITHNKLLVDKWLARGASGLWMFAPNKTSLLLLLNEVKLMDTALLIGMKKQYKFEV